MLNIRKKARVAEKRGQAHFPTERPVDPGDVGSLKNRQTPFFSLQGLTLEGTSAFII
jgi:hypothetical protein